MKTITRTTPPTGSRTISPTITPTRSRTVTPIHTRTSTSTGSRTTTSTPSRITTPTGSRTITPARRPLVLALAAVTTLCVATPAAAATSEPAATTRQEAAPRFHLDLEVDPTAYIFRGYSAHLGLGWKHVRPDLGIFAMDLPAAFAGTDDFDVSFTGYGAKLQLFPFAEQRGAFVGIDLGVARPRVKRKGTALEHTYTEVSPGVNFGYRLTVGDHFFATAWLGLGYGLERRKIELGGASYQPSRLTVFPAIHLGWRFL